MEQRLNVKTDATARDHRPDRPPKRQHPAQFPKQGCPPALVQYQPGADQPISPSDGSLLAHITYGPTHRMDPDPRRIVIGLPPIGAGYRELWRLPADCTESGWHGDIGFVTGGGYLFAHLLAHEAAGADLAAVTQHAYRRLLAFIRGSACPELLRAWNYVERINDRERGVERYQGFCKGRAEAFAEAGIPPQGFPAATAIGSRAAGLSVHFLTASRPGVPLENPRQLSAYRYPPPYGPRPPSFARAMSFRGPHASRELAISGTASIVGHVTMHPRNLGRQLRETLRNLDLLMAHARQSPCHPCHPQLLLKVYLRDPQRLAEVGPMLEAWAGQGAQIMFLHGEICRRKLEIEIEAHRSMPRGRTARLRRMAHA